MAKERPTEFRVPTLEEDRVRFGRVGIIAVVGFLIGIAWPALAGKSLAPEAPGEGEPEPEPAASASAAPAPPGPAAAKAAPADEPELTKERSVEIGGAKVTSCRNSKGTRLRECDDIAFDESGRAHLSALAGCPAAKGASGVLSLGFELDFDANEIRKITGGRSTTLEKDVAKRLVECARKEFASASIRAIEHQHASYTLFYPTTFVPAGEEIPETKAADAGTRDTPASGLATVSWDVALIRSTPKDGAIVARLLMGTRVAVEARRDDWYKISYDAKGSKGWVYRGAIGL